MEYCDGCCGGWYTNVGVFEWQCSERMVYQYRMLGADEDARFQGCGPG